VHLDAALTQCRLIQENVVARPAAADRVHVRMLELQERVADLAVGALLVQPRLEGERVRVRDRTEPASV
jgi:hypothetical protein